MSDLNDLFFRQEIVKRWSAENENANARLQIANIRKRMAELLSQYEPINSLNIDREKLREIFRFILWNQEIKLEDKNDGNDRRECELHW